MLHGLLHDLGGGFEVIGHYPRCSRAFSCLNRLENHCVLGVPRCHHGHPFVGEGIESQT